MLHDRAQVQPSYAAREGVVGPIPRRPGLLAPIDHSTGAPEVLPAQAFLTEPCNLTPSERIPATAGCDFLHHLLHVPKLVEQAIHLGDRST